jgi:hypothetical protein
LRFEESLVKICIDKLEDSARRIDELRRIHVDENYEGNIKPLVANEIREKIEEYLKVWNILKNYFEEEKIKYAPDLEDISSILWSLEFEEKYQPQDDMSLIMESMEFTRTGFDGLRRSQNEDVSRPDLFQALKDIDQINELSYEESSLLSLQENKVTPSLSIEPTFIESDPIKSFQDFYSKILDKKRSVARTPSMEETPDFTVQPYGPVSAPQGGDENRYVKDSSNEILDKIDLMNQYRDYVYRLRPNLHTPDDVEVEEYPLASDMVSPVDEANLYPNNAKEFNNKLKYYMIEEDPDSSDVTNLTPDLAVYHIGNDIAEKKDDLDAVNEELETSILKGDLETSVIQEPRMTPVVGSLVKDFSLIFGIVIFASGVYLLSTNILSLSEIESAETTIQILYSIIDQLPGVPISINLLGSFNDLISGVVVLTIGIITVMISVGLMRGIGITRSIGALLYLFSAMFDVVDMLYFGLIESPISIIVFVINLVICGVFLKDEFWVL